jgi:hypothetical protein
VGAALPVLGLVAGVAGAGISAYGTYQGLQSQSANAAYQAQVAANNTKIAQQNQSWDVQAGEVAAGNQGLKTRAMVGQTKAEQGASGLDVNSGSFVGARAGEAEIGALDALTIRSAAAKKAYAASVQANNYTAEGQLDTAESTQAANAAPIAATGSLLSSASSVGASWAKYLGNTG